MRQNTPEHWDRDLREPPPATIVGVGAVWSWSQRLADVYYELAGRPDQLRGTGEAVLRAPRGRITLLFGNWERMLNRQEWGLELHLGNGQILPFLIFGSVRPMLWIRPLSDAETLVLPEGQVNGKLSRWDSTGPPGRLDIGG